MSMFTVSSKESDISIGYSSSGSDNKNCTFCVNINNIRKMTAKQNYTYKDQSPWDLDTRLKTR